MKISILGTGAIGSLFAAGLSEKHDLTCIVKPESHAEAIRRDGIRIVEADGSVRTAFPEAVTETGGMQPSQLVLIAVKAPSTGEAVRTHRDIFGEETFAISLQNGYGNHADIESVVSPERILIGTTAQGANIDSEGRVHHAGSGMTTIGALRPESEKAARMLAEVKKIFDDAGLKTEITEDAEDAVIRKLFINTGINAVCALNDTKNIGVVTDPQMNEQARLLVMEAVDVFRRAGREYDAQEIWQHVLSVARATGENYCSMVQDIRKGRPTEILRINGAVADIARSLHFDAPLNRKVTAEVEALSKRR